MEGSNLFSEINRNPDQRSLNGFVDRLRRTRVRTYVHTYIHTYIHTCMHACVYIRQAASERRGRKILPRRRLARAHRRHRRTAINVTALANGVVEI